MKKNEPDEVDAIMDAAMHDVLADVPDTSWAGAARRSRALGTALLGLACVCIASIALLPRHDPISATGTLVLMASALLLLCVGAWFIDGASRRETRARLADLSELARTGLDGLAKNRSQPDIRRQRHFGFSMLVLAGFCACVAVTPLPSQQGWDIALWTGFTITLVCVGALQLRKASNAAAHAEQRLRAHKRISAQAGTHIRTVR